MDPKIFEQIQTRVNHEFNEITKIKNDLDTNCENSEIIISLIERYANVVNNLPEIGKRITKKDMKYVPEAVKTIMKKNFEFENFIQDLADAINSHSEEKVKKCIIEYKL